MWHSFKSLATIATVLMLISSKSSLASDDTFEEYDCVKFVNLVDTLAKDKEEGLTRSEAIKMAGKLKIRQFARAVASVYEFQKDYSRKELKLYTLGWCEGHNETIEGGYIER